MNIYIPATGAEILTKRSLASDTFLHCNCPRMSCLLEYPWLGRGWGPHFAFFQHGKVWVDMWLLTASASSLLLCLLPFCTPCFASMSGIQALREPRG